MVSPPPSGGMVWLYSMLPQGGMGARDWSLQLKAALDEFVSHCRQIRDRMHEAARVPA